MSNPSPEHVLIIYPVQPLQRNKRRRPSERVEDSTFVCLKSLDHLTPWLQFLRMASSWVLELTLWEEPSWIIPGDVDSPRVPPLEGNLTVAVAERSWRFGWLGDPSVHEGAFWSRVLERLRRWRLHFRIHPKGVSWVPLSTLTLTQVALSGYFSVV